MSAAQPIVVENRKDIAGADSERLIEASEQRMMLAVAQAFRIAAQQTGTTAILDETIRTLDIHTFSERAASIVGRRISNAYVAEVMRSGIAATIMLRPQIGADFDFDTIDPALVSMMQLERQRIVSSFTAEQTNATLESINRSFNISRRTQVQIARQLRASIGLTGFQQNAVNNYRAALENAAEGDRGALSRILRDRRFDPTVRRAARTRTPLSTQQIDRMVDRYRERQINWRAATIAQTEAVRAVNVAQDQALLQMVGAGRAEPRDIRRIWVTAGDERVRSSHRFMSGQVRSIEEPFMSSGGPLRYPGDPSGPASETVRCRCHLRIEIGDGDG